MKFSRKTPICPLFALGFYNSILFCIYTAFFFKCWAENRASAESGLIWHLCPLTLCPLFWHLNDTLITITKKAKSHIVSQQTTRDSKRRASKEAGAVSKDVQTVGLNAAGDPEPMECVWAEMDTSQDCAEEVEDDPSRAVFSRRWKSTRGCCLLLTLASCAPSVTWTCSAITCICFLPKRLGMLHLFVPLQMHAWSWTWLQNRVLKLHRAFPMACAIYCDMPILRAETKESICTVCVCGARVGPPWWTCLIIVQVLYMHSIVYDH